MDDNSEKSFDILALEKFMKEHGYSRKDLEEQLGTRARVSEVLSGKRQLSISMLKNLVNNWNMDANLLLKDPSLKTKKVQPKKSSSEEKTSIVWMLD
ncbi:MAG: helix-turn-helix domain-containing protein [Opitutales bacterium]|nr:helix-turn-helix domain-containing protein [Opitutales bacterium]MBP3358105.1 helix-turn-helix domain-containing protein [Opitutales bacterium]MBQ2722652.1 helix-turn-helix domain-containing protein [Opitutales bacterium]